MNWRNLRQGSPSSGDLLQAPGLGNGMACVRRHFEKGTPDAALDLARRILGSDNVHVFTR